MDGTRIFWARAGQRPPGQESERIDKTTCREARRSGSTDLFWGMELASEKGVRQGANSRNSWLLREFTTPQGVFFHGQVRPHELISASLVS